MAQSRILVVDDEAGVRTTLTGILEDEGFEVATAADGEEALAAVRSHAPHVVLLDIWMPGRDGLEVLPEIRSLAPGVAVIMISGHGTVETAVKATKLGAFDFVEKPLSLEKIIVTVRNAVAPRSRNCGRRSCGRRRPRPGCSSTARTAPARNWSPA